MRQQTSESIDKVVADLILEFESKDWVLDVVASRDDGGPLIEVIVNGYFYPKSDPLARYHKGFPVCVVRKMIRVKGEKLV